MSANHGASANGAAPTVFHITHYRAGSQWLHVIFRRTVRDLIVEPDPDLAQFFERPIEAGKVYPTLYITHEEFQRAELPQDWRRFVVIRDLRDTLVSGYNSLRHSHEDRYMNVDAQSFRRRLEEMSVEDGLAEVMRGWLPPSAAWIQESWVRAGEPLIRYEDLLANDVEILERTLIDRCRLPIHAEALQVTVESGRFEAMTKRPLGEEDVSQHQTSGAPGAWRRYFTDSLKDRFKEKWGHLLIATGYESDLEW